MYIIRIKAENLDQNMKCISPDHQFSVSLFTNLRSSPENQNLDRLSLSLFEFNEISLNNSKFRSLSLSL